MNVNFHNATLAPRLTQTVAAIVSLLRDGDAVLRCAAARALASLGEVAAAPALLDALLDEDADVRTDAMSALVRCAQPGDADLIRRSLVGDPVKEVKIAAVQALGRLGEATAVPLLRALARDRCEPEFAWEDGAGLWDDWLDVQLAAIEALGEIGDVAAIDDLLDARRDELGQNLDHAVFAALARMPRAGVSVLVEIVHTGTARERRRALAALAEAGADLPAGTGDRLAGDPDPEIRRLAVGCADLAEERVFQLACRDADAAVRRAAVAAHAPVRPDIARAALADPDESVRVLALGPAVDHLSPSERGDLAANVEAWMQTAGPVLAAACAAVLVRMTGTAAAIALGQVAAETARPESVRIAALQAMPALGSAEAVAALRNASTDKVRQIRLAGLGGLAELARTGPRDCRAAASTALAAAANGEIGSAAPAAQPPREEAAEVSAPKTEEVRAGTVRITRDGNIVPADDSAPATGSGDEAAPADSHPLSTLAAIQAPPAAAAGGDDAAAAGMPARRRRVAVDGPDDFAADIRVLALGLAAECTGPEIDRCLTIAMQDDDPAVQTAAIAALAGRAQRIALTPDMIEHLIAALDDPRAEIRGHAAAALSPASIGQRHRLEPLLDDPDPVVREIALRNADTVGHRKVLASLRDPALPVRRAALERILAQGNAPEVTEAVAVLVEDRRSDCLIASCRQHDGIHEIMAAMLAAGSLDRGRTGTLLDAIAGAGPIPTGAADLAERRAAGVGAL